MKRTTWYLGLSAMIAMVAACATDGPSNLSSGSWNGATDGNSSSSAEASSGAGAGPSESAFDFYRNNVNDALVAECALCHGESGTAPIWLSGDEAQSNYDTMLAYGGLIEAPDCSQIVIKSNGDHAGPPMSAGLEADVLEWLDMEAEERGLECGGGGGGTGGGGTVESCDDLFAEFQSCMYQNHWNATGMDLMPLQQTANDGPCTGCHAAGNGAHLSLDPVDTFQAHKADKYNLLKLVNCAIVGGEVQGLVPSGRYINKGIEPCVGEPCHPDYVLNAANMAAVTDYVDEVLLAVETGTCEDLANIPEDQQ